jgi:DNA-binding NarL/FixJ family response regulator
MRTHSAPAALPDADPIRVLIADGNDIFRSGLKNLLRREGIDVVGECRASAETVALATRLRPDVILIDAAPAAAAEAATRQLVAADPDATVIVLASDADEAAVLGAIGAGARGFLVKDAEPGDFAAAARSAAAGGCPISPHAAVHVLGPVRTKPAHGEASLTARETVILRHLVDGLSNREIADELVVSPVTVKHHVASILEKLGAANRVQAAVHAVRRGLA